jgi:Sulfatase
MSPRAVWIWFLFLLIALWLLRAQLIVAVGVSFKRVVALGLLCGVLLDLAMALLVTGAAVCIGARWPGFAHSTAFALSTVVLGFTMANVAYFEYFDTRLEPWVIRKHLSDLRAIGGSVRSVLSVPALFACLAVPLLLLTLTSGGYRSSAPVAPVTLGAVLVVGALAVALSGTAVKHLLVQGSSIVAEQVFLVWIEGELGLRPLRGAARRRIELTLRNAAAIDPFAPSRLLAMLRDWDPQTQPPPASDVAARPLVRELEPDRAHTLALRVRLGLPVDGPIHVIILFLESVRAFEMEHPALGPQIFSRTRALLARHALRFPTAYASAPGAGKTVQGQFAALCSLLPNFGGAPVYTAYPHLRVKSLAEIARDHGYHTVWISGGPEGFHNKRGFESLHGIDRFFGFEYMRTIPVAGMQPTCGYPDGPMLQEGVRILERETQDGRPVFASILTLSTHHPVSEIPEGPVPAALRAAAQAWPAQRDYVGYLSRLRYLDESLERFFGALFDNPLGDRTLVVLLADHGQRYRPHLPIAQHQVVEMMSRIPFALVTKHPPAPGVIPHAVHQIDVAPTVADIVGFRGHVAWTGRNALDSPGGSPWILAENDQLHYRVLDRACYTLQGDDAPSCYRIESGVDPMLTFELPRIRADLADLRFFQSVAIAARQAITLNLVMPAPRDQ